MKIELSHLICGFPKHTSYINFRLVCKLSLWSTHIFYFLQVVIVGNGAVGKSSMIQRYCRGTFTREYKKTIGVDFLERQIQWVNYVFFLLQFKVSNVNDLDIYADEMSKILVHIIRIFLKSALKFEIHIWGELWNGFFSIAIFIERFWCPAGTLVSRW